MDYMKNQNEKDKSGAFNPVGDDDRSQNQPASISVPAANSSQAPFADTATISGQRGVLDQGKDQRHLVPSVTRSLEGESTAAASLLLSSSHLANTNKSGILLRTGVLAARQLDTTAKQQVYSKGENLNKMSTHVNTGTTISPDMKDIQEPLNTKYLDKRAARTSKVPNSTPPLSRQSVKSTGMDQVEQSSTHPGAMAIFPGSNHNPVLSPQCDGITLVHADNSRAQAGTVLIGSNGIEADGEPTLKAFLVNDDTGVVASATLLDIEAEEKKNRRRRMRTILGSFITASIIATAVAVPVVLTRSGPAQTIVGSPTSSPIPSAEPSFIPTSSPSTALFGFLAANSFDGGSALDIPGSSQQMALDWLLNVLGIFEMDYHLLQNYALVTLYYETAGKQWISTEDFDFKRTVLQTKEYDEFFTGEWLNVTSSVNPLGFCNWQGVVCNDDGEIDSLTLSSNRLKGSIPAELGMLHKSLSTFLKACIDKDIMFCP